MLTPCSRSQYSQNKAMTQSKLVLGPVIVDPVGRTHSLVCFLVVKVVFTIHYRVATMQCVQQTIVVSRKVLAINAANTVTQWDCKTGSPISPKYE